jgi:hypothetical protein
VRDKYPQVVKLLDTKNWIFVELCNYNHKTLSKFYPYKVMYIHELKQPDYVERINFCSRWLEDVHDEIIDPQLVFVTNIVLFIVL